jgi:hypothetical protein
MCLFEDKAQLRGLEKKLKTKTPGYITQEEEVKFGSVLERRNILYHAGHSLEVLKLA